MVKTTLASATTTIQSRYILSWVLSDGVAARGEAGVEGTVVGVLLLARIRLVVLVPALPPRLPTLLAPLYPPEQPGKPLTELGCAERTVPAGRGPRGRPRLARVVARLLSRPGSALALVSRDLLRALPLGRIGVRGLIRRGLGVSRGGISGGRVTFRCAIPSLAAIPA